MSTAAANAKRILTVGHSNHSLEHFLQILQRNSVEVVVEVRSYPYSSYSPQFDREALKSSLAKAGIKYVDLGKELGGRPEGSEFYDSEGHVLYDRVAGAPFFQEGLQRLEEGASRYCVTLMCSEEDPTICHRGLLISRVLRERGYQVEHIRGDGTRQPDNEVFTPPAEPPQASLFDHAKEPAWKSIPSVLPGKKQKNSSSF
jgi:uncharacterized protein (DUF488 family)